MGVCVTCIMKVVDGVAPAEAQVGLRKSLAAQGHEGGSFRMKGDGFLEKLKLWMKEFF